MTKITTILIRPPPTSTLFPYTTLFRSRSMRADRSRASADRCCSQLTRARTAALCTRSPDRRRDRKSTRLNSSHSQISYAVFCLKKKTEVVYDDDHNDGYKHISNLRHHL